MIISLNDLILMLAAETVRLREKAPNEAALNCLMDNGHQVTVAMKRILIDDNVPKEAQRSAYKAVRDTAKVTITPPNEELETKVSKFFFSEIIPGSMGAPARLFFDEVLINQKSVIG